MKHKLGIIGFGSMASGYHVNTVNRPDIDLEVAAVFDIRPERREAARAAGFKTYDNIADFLADGSFDLVLVATSNNNHMPCTCMALEAGYNVICEKPAALNAEQVEKMIETAERCGRLFTIHQNRRFDRDFMMAQKVITDGTIGKPYVIESRVGGKDGSGALYNWRAMKDHGGGMLPDWGVHMLDQLLWLNRDRRLESVYANIYRVASTETDDNSHVTLCYSDGLICRMEVKTYSPCMLPRWYILGDKGGATMADMGSTFMNVRRIAKEHTDINKAPAYTSDGFDYREQPIRKIDEFEEFTLTDAGLSADWGNIYKNILDVLDGKAELLVKPEEVLLCMRVIDAAYKSSETGEAVKL